VKVTATQLRHKGKRLPDDELEAKVGYLEFEPATDDCAPAIAYMLMYSNAPGSIFKRLEQARVVRIVGGKLAVQGMQPEYAAGKLLARYPQTWLCELEGGPDDLAPHAGGASMFVGR